MKLCIKQKVFSWADKFSIMDINGTPLFFANGEILSWGKKLHVFDTSGQEILFIKQKLMTFLPKFEIYANNTLLAEIIKEFTFFTPRYSVKGLGWDIQGDYFAHEYQIMQSGSQIAYIHKQWFTWGDCYVLEILNEENCIPALGVMLAVDCIADIQRN